MIRALAPAPGTPGLLLGVVWVLNAGAWRRALGGPKEPPATPGQRDCQPRLLLPPGSGGGLQAESPLHLQQGHGAAVQRGGGDPPRGAGGGHHHELEAGPLRTGSGQDGAGERGERQGGRQRTRS